MDCPKLSRANPTEGAWARHVRKVIAAVPYPGGCGASDATVPHGGPVETIRVCFGDVGIYKRCIAHATEPRLPTER